MTRRNYNWWKRDGWYPDPGNSWARKTWKSGWESRAEGRSDGWSAQRSAEPAQGWPEQHDGDAGSPGVPRPPAASSSDAAVGAPPVACPSAQPSPTAQAPRTESGAQDSFMSACLLGNEIGRPSSSATPSPAACCHPGPDGAASVQKVSGIDELRHQAEKLWTERDTIDEGCFYKLETGATELGQWTDDTNAWSLYSIEGSPFGLAACNKTQREHFNYQPLN